ncbi:hypothetical protein ISN45_At03g022010, partial [Arabidopsis thaliana x Arabidopsis arenosa]
VKLPLLNLITHPLFLPPNTLTVYPLPHKLTRYISIYRAVGGTNLQFAIP